MPPQSDGYEIEHSTAAGHQREDPLTFINSHPTRKRVRHRTQQLNQERHANHQTSTKRTPLTTSGGSSSGSMN